ncbi:MAG: site-specific integrase, partial [Candidatus Omnitrophota bacterium]|nr:site-specific integrase [Candidatus Omnitrophota bacterium]
VAIAEGKFLDIKKEQKIKFDDFANEYLEIYSKPNIRSWKSDLHNFNCIKSFFGELYLHEITSLIVEKFKIERVKEVKPATVNRALARLKSMFNKAIDWGKFNGVNPVKTVKFFVEENQRTRYLEKEEIAKFLEHCKGSIKSIVVIALNTGMRKSEILNLKWHDIDFKRGIIYLLRTKNNEKREIPMNDAVKTVFINVNKHPESQYIFSGKDGKPLQNIRKSFFTALRKAGIINFRFHDLRHTFASHLVMSGVDLNTVRELLGHKSLEMTLRYSHLSPDHKKRAVDVLGRHIDPFWTIADKEEMEPKDSEFATVLNT